MMTLQRIIHEFFERNPGASDRQATAHLQRSHRDYWQGYYVYFQALERLVKAGKLVEAERSPQGVSKWKVAA